MTEKALWNTLKDNIGHVGHFERIESHATATGKPDVSYCIDGNTGDIELKVYRPEKGGFVLRASQNAWIGKRLRAKGRCFILARYDHGGGKQFLLIEGKQAKFLIHDRTPETWLRLAKYVWIENVDWQLLREALCGQQ